MSFFAMTHKECALAMLLGTMERTGSESPLRETPSCDIRMILELARPKLPSMIAVSCKRLEIYDAEHIREMALPDSGLNRTTIDVVHTHTRVVSIYASLSWAVRICVWDLNTDTVKCGLFDKEVYQWDSTSNISDLTEDGLLAFPITYIGNGVGILLCDTTAERLVEKRVVAKSPLNHTAMIARFTKDQRAMYVLAGIDGGHCFLYRFDRDETSLEYIHMVSSDIDYMPIWFNAALAVEDDWIKIYKSGMISREILYISIKDPRNRKTTRYSGENMYYVYPAGPFERVPAGGGLYRFFRDQTPVFEIKTGDAQELMMTSPDCRFYYTLPNKEIRMTTVRIYRTDCPGIIERQIELEPDMRVELFDFLG